MDELRIYIYKYIFLSQFLYKINIYLVYFQKIHNVCNYILLKIDIYANFNIYIYIFILSDILKYHFTICVSEILRKYIL